MKQLLMLFQLLLFGACPFAIESNPLEPSGFNTPLTFTVLLPPHRWLLALSRLWAAYRAVPPEWWLRLTVISFTVRQLDVYGVLVRVPGGAERHGGRDEKGRGSVEDGRRRGTAAQDFEGCGATGGTQSV
ncbi:hypothetical protein PWT90_04584 [Aphanocladium album]|nr:hypothetical protein PWT90_04584 [Aphanocladium album]